MKKCISGVILFDETLRQTTSNGKSIPELIKKADLFLVSKLIKVQKV